MGTGNRLGDRLTTSALHPEVLVIGAGISGIALAVGLHQKGIRVLLVERDLTVRDRFKGEFLQPYTVSVLRELGLCDVFENAEAVKIRELRFRDLSTQADTLIRYPDSTYAYSIPHRSMLEGLREKARAVLGGRFIEGAVLEPLGLESSGFYKQPRFSIKGRGIITPQWVVGCDGRQSTVRAWMKGPKAPANGAPTLGAKPEFLVGLETEQTLALSSRYEVIRTKNSGTVSVFSLGNNRQRIYWNAPAIKEVSNKTAWENALKNILTEVSPKVTVQSKQLATLNFEKVVGAPADTAWLGPVSREKILLAGDSLAVTTPLGGQGMTCGMYHVSSLLRLLPTACKTKGIQNRVATVRLRTVYEKESKYWFKRVNLLNLGLYYLFFARGQGFKWVTQHVLNIWNQHPEMRDRVGALFGGNDQDIPGIFEVLKLWGMTPAFDLNRILRGKTIR